MSTFDAAGEGAPGGKAMHATGDSPGGRSFGGPTYAALDLGTNNCRLLVARPAREGFRIIDAFSRIVRLGEGLSQTGRLGEPAIQRTIAALDVCRDKMESRGVSRARLIATEACRSAGNGADFIARVRDETGLNLEIVDRETEALLAAAGCASLADPGATGIVLFDIGGGSSEIVWLAREREWRAGAPQASGDLRQRVRQWASLPLGVVTLSEKFGGIDVDHEAYEKMVDYVTGHLRPFLERTASEGRCDRFHLLGTSGTVTTIAGIHLGLLRYERRRVDGIWMDDADVRAAIQQLRSMTWADRVANGCIGHDRADLVLAGCAIFDAIWRAFPSRRVRIADRGLREGILMQLMGADRAWSAQGAIR